MSAEQPTIRCATPHDSRACFDVFLAAIRDLTARQNVPWDPESSLVGNATPTATSRGATRSW